MRGLIWVAQVLLAPLLMGAVLAGLTLWLARQEFRTQLPRRKIKTHRMICARASHQTLGPWLGSLMDHNRDLLVRFWLAAPEDLLPSLWSSPIGESTKQLVQQLDPQYVFI